MKFLYRPLAAALGGILVLAGLVMLVTPGPGLLTILAGIAVLGRQYHWARRLLHKLREKWRAAIHSAEREK